MINKFLLTGDKFRAELHLKQSRFTDSAGGSFTKNKIITQTFKETEGSSYTYKRN